MSIPASPNWYNSRACDWDGKQLIYGSKHTIQFLSSAVDADDANQRLLSNTVLRVHTQRVTSVQFVKNTQFCASCSLDTSVCVTNYAGTQPLLVARYNHKVLHQ